MRIMLRFLILQGIFVLCSLQSHGQVADGTYKVGDTLPEVQFRHILNYKAEKASLSELAKKKLIIDFWGRWCSSCIAAFPHLDKVLERYKDSLLIVTVTREFEKDVRGMMKTSVGVGSSKMPFIVEDTIMHNMIGPRYFPFQVWIDEMRVIRRVLVGKIDTANLQAFIAGRQMKFDHLKAVGVNDTLSLSDSAKEYKSRTYYSRLIKESGAESMKTTSFRNDVVLLRDFAMIELIIAAYQHKVRSSKWIFRKEDGKIAEADIRAKFPDLYSYVVKLGSEMGKERITFYELLANDLKNKFGIVGEIKKEKKVFYLLQANQKFMTSDIVTRKDDRLPIGEILNNVVNVQNSAVWGFAGLLERLINEGKEDYVKVVPDPGISNVYINVKEEIKGNSLEQINGTLIKYGLYLKPEIRDAEVLYLTY